MVSQEHRPLAPRRQRRRLREDIDDGETVLHLDRHEHPRHDRKVKVHVALVAVAEVRGGVLGPLVGLGEEHPVGPPRVDVRAELLQELVRRLEVLAVRALGLVEIGDGVEPQPVDAEAEPEVDDLEHRRVDRRVIEVEVRLVGKEAMPEVGVRLGVPRPVRRFEIFEDDARFLVSVGRLAPHVELALGAAGRRAARPQEPWVLVRGVIHHELGHDPDAARMRLVDHDFQVVDRPHFGVHGHVIRDVVAVVAAGRRAERQQPDRGDAEILDVVELRGEAREVSDAVAVRVEERARAKLVNDRVLVPERVARGVSARRGRGVDSGEGRLRLGGHGDVFRRTDHHRVEMKRRTDDVVNRSVENCSHSVNRSR